VEGTAKTVGAKVDTTVTNGRRQPLLKGRGLSSSKRKREQEHELGRTGHGEAAAVPVAMGPPGAAGQNKVNSSLPASAFGRFVLFGCEALLWHLNGQEERVRARTRQCQGFHPPFVYRSFLLSLRFNSCCPLQRHHRFRD
jgi:hypothetical protein